MMTPKERVKESLSGRLGDRPPIGFWGHNFVEENAAESLAKETVRVVKLYGWDFAKIQNRATSFAEGWGVRFTPSTEFHVMPDVVELPVKEPSDLLKIKPLDPHEGVLGENLDALRMIREALGKEFPIIQTVFSPTMVLPYFLEKDMYKHGQALREIVEGHPGPVRQALKAITETYVNFTKAALESGADGVFYSIKPAGKNFLTLEQYKEFGLEDDAKVLEAAYDGWFNMLHLCGMDVYFDVIPDLPCHAINYEVSPNHPRLSEARDKYGKTVMGGVSPKPYIAGLTPEQVAQEVTVALEDTQGIGFMVAPGCSISPETSEENLMAPHKAVSDWLAKRVN